MIAVAPPDLRGLAALAQTKGRELRPLLLRIHTLSFVEAPARTRDLVAAYEALALGLIPLVSDEVAAEIAATLADTPDTPASVRDLLADRTGARPAAAHVRGEGRGRERAAEPGLLRADILRLVSEADGATDLALAGNRAVVLDAHALDELVRRGRSSPALARALLARAELSVFDRAALFRFADDTARDRIRHQFGLRAAVNAQAPPVLPDERRELMLSLARSGRLADLAAAIGQVLKVDLPVPALDVPAEGELFAVALVAAGLGIEDCIKVFLTVDPILARSVPLVFHLAAICRATQPAVALNLVRCAGEPAKAPVRRTRKAKAAKAAPDIAVAASRPRRTAREPLLTPGEAPPEPARSASARAGRRSRSTTGRDRT